MIFIHSDPMKKNIEQIDKYIEGGKDVFVLIYMEGCGPCIATRPEWNKIKEALGSKYYANNNIVVADVDKDLISSLKYIGDIDGFPTIKYISKNGQHVECYENSNISKKDRSVESFVEWIESKINKREMKGGASSPYHLVKRLHNNYGVPKNNNKNKLSKRHKWSLKYKRSINCKTPKGFSQKQYCRRRNKLTKRKKR